MSGEDSKFSDREQKVMALAFQCLKDGPPNIDYPKLASLLGMGNPRSASNAWAPIRKKLFEGEGGTASPTKSTSKRASKKNGAAVKEEDEDEPEETTAPKATPSKRKAANKDGSISPKKRGKAAAVKQEDREDSVTEEIVREPSGSVEHDDDNF